MRASRFSILFLAAFTATAGPLAGPTLQAQTAAPPPAATNAELTANDPPVAAARPAEVRYVSENTGWPILSDLPYIGRWFRSERIYRVRVPASRRASAPAQPAKERIETSRILVAARDLNIGDQLNAESLSYEDWPADRVPEGVMTDLEKINDFLPNTRIFKGEPILHRKLIDNWADSLPPIPPGYRVVPVKVNETTAPSLLLPGDRVDILVFLRRNNDIKVTQTRTVLNGARVYAVNSQTERVVEDGRMINAKTIHLLIKPKEVELLMLATELGPVRLSLRGHNDTVEVEHTGTNVTALLASDNANDANDANEASDCLPPVPEGYRVVPLKVHETQVPKGLQPGDMVDIRCLLPRDEQVMFQRQDPTLTSVRVFAVNKQTERVIEDGREVRARTVSVLVKPDQVEMLLIATENYLFGHAEQDDDAIVSQPDGDSSPGHQQVAFEALHKQLVEALTENAQLKARAETFEATLELQAKIAAQAAREEALERLLVLAAENARLRTQAEYIGEVLELKDQHAAELAKAKLENAKLEARLELTRQQQQLQQQWVKTQWELAHKTAERAAHAARQQQPHAQRPVPPSYGAVPNYNSPPAYADPGHAPTPRHAPPSAGSAAPASPTPPHTAIRPPAATKSE